MIEQEEPGRDLAALVVPLAGGWSPLGIGGSRTGCLMLAA